MNTDERREKHLAKGRFPNKAKKALELCRTALSNHDWASRYGHPVPFTDGQIEDILKALEAIDEILPRKDYVRSRFEQLRKREEERRAVQDPHDIQGAAV